MCAISTIEWITTPRLRLRPLSLTDAARLTALINDYGVAKMTGGIAHPYGLEDATAYLEGRTARSSNGWRFAIDLPDEGLVGVVGLARRDGPLLELGYWLGRPYWGRGYATEAASATVQWARDAHDVRAIVAGHFEDNPISGRVLEKAGFLYTGLVEPMFSLARGEAVRTRKMAWLA